MKRIIKPSRAIDKVLLRPIALQNEREQDERLARLNVRQTRNSVRKEKRNGRLR